MSRKITTPIMENVSLEVHYHTLDSGAGEDNHAAAISLRFPHLKDDGETVAFFEERTILLDREGTQTLIESLQSVLAGHYKHPLGVYATAKKIEHMILVGQLSPAARDMDALEVLVQWADANALTIKQAQVELARYQG